MIGFNGTRFAANLPGPLCVAALVTVVVAGVLLSLAHYGKTREGWGIACLFLAAFLLVLGFLIAGSQA